MSLSVSDTYSLSGYMQKQLKHYYQTKNKSKTDLQSILDVFFLVFSSNIIHLHPCLIVNGLSSFCFFLLLLIAKEKGKNTNWRNHWRKLLDKNVKQNLGLALTSIYICKREKEKDICRNANPTNNTPTKKLSASYTF